MQDRTGQRIRGMYIGAYEYDGVVRKTCIELNGLVMHLVDLLDPIFVYEHQHYVIFVTESEPFSVIEHVGDTL